MPVRLACRFYVFSDVYKRQLVALTNITNEEILNWLISSKNKFDKEHDEEYPEDVYKRQSHY